MKVLVLFDYPAPPEGLATQGALLYRGLCEMWIEAHAVNFESAQEKEWYYRRFKPDVVAGVGYWGHTSLNPGRTGSRTSWPGLRSVPNRRGCCYNTKNSSPAFTFRP